MHHRAQKAPDFPEALRQRGLKATPSRVRVLEALQAAGTPLSIRQLVNTLAAKPSFKVTVYRILDDLSGAGLVRQVDLRRPHAYYELEDPEDHHHLVCVECERVEDFTGCEANRVAARALKRSKQFASVTGHSFELFGICKACRVR